MPDVCGTDIAHFAVAYQHVQRVQRLFNWNVRRRAVKLVEIDVVGLQAT